MDIGFFTDSYFPTIDGVTYTLKLWRERLEAAGHTVWIVYPDGDYEPGERELPVASLPNPFYPEYPVPTVRRTSTLPDLDVVHCHGPGPVGILGRYYAWRQDLPAIYTHHTPVEAYFHQGVRSDLLGRLIAKAYLPWENTFLGSFDVVTASTARIERSVDHVELPVGIDMDFFSPRSEPPVDVFPDGWPEDRPVIGYSGRISDEKNLGEVIRLAERLPEYEFVIVGEGPDRENQEPGAPENVTFRDFLPRESLPHFYSAVDVFVTASTADTLGLSTLEANACGTPVAAADVPPFDDTIRPQNGRRFEYGDLDAMEDAVQACLDHSLDTRVAVEQYDVERTLADLEEIYTGESFDTDGAPTIDPAIAVADAEPDRP